MTMKLQSILEQYSSDTQRVSEIARGANYSLIAICWVLAHETVDNLSDFRSVLILVIVSLLLDFLQYLVRGEMERRHFNKQEDKARTDNSMIDEDYEAEPYPKLIKRVSSVFYYLKITTTIFAFVLLIINMIL